MEPEVNEITKYLLLKGITEDELEKYKFAVIEQYKNSLQGGNSNVQ